MQNAVFVAFCLLSILAKVNDPQLLREITTFGHVLKQDRWTD